MSDKRAEVEACVAILVRLTDEFPELDDLCALLCAVGAACGDEVLAAQLIDAITPVMEASYRDMLARNN